MDTGYKMYAEIIREKLEKRLERRGLLDDTQISSRKRRGTMDAIYILSKAMEKELDKKGVKVHAFFADMEAAFDKIRRKVVWEMMRKMGLGNRIRTRVKRSMKKQKTL